MRRVVSDTSFQRGARHRHHSRPGPLAPLQDCPSHSGPVHHGGPGPHAIRKQRPPRARRADRHHSALQRSAPSRASVSELRVGAARPPRRRNACRCTHPPASDQQGTIPDSAPCPPSFHLRTANLIPLGRDGGAGCGRYLEAVVGGVRGAVGHPAVYAFLELPDSV